MSFSVRYDKCELFRFLWQRDRIFSIFFSSLCVTILETVRPLALLGAIMQAKNHGRAKLRLSRRWRVLPGSDGASERQNSGVRSCRSCRMGGRSWGDHEGGESW